MIAQGKHLIVRLDGKTMADRWDENGPLAGRFALQVYHEHTIVHFEKVEIKELPPSPPALDAAVDVAKADAPVVVQGGQPFLLRIPGNVGSAWMAASPDGRLLAMPSRNLVLFDTSNGHIRHTLLHNHTGLYRVAFSADSKHLAAVGGDEIIRIWNTATGEQEVNIRWFGEGVLRGLAFSPDGQRLAVGGSAPLPCTTSGTAKLHGLHGHTDAIFGIAFNRDGSVLVTASFDRTAKVWDVATGAIIVHPRGAHGPALERRLQPGRPSAGDRQRQGMEAVGRKSAAGGASHHLNAYLAVVLQGDPLAAAACSSYFLTVPRRRSVPGAAGWLAFAPDGKTLLTGGHNHQGGSVHTLWRWDVAPAKSWLLGCR